MNLRSNRSLHPCHTQATYAQSGKPWTLVPFVWTQDTTSNKLMCPHYVACAYVCVASEDQAPVVQRVDSAIHWITQLVLLALIPWMVIYPVDSIIHLLNNWARCHKIHVPCTIIIQVLCHRWSPTEWHNWHTKLAFETSEARNLFKEC